MRTLFLGSGYTGNYYRILYPYTIHSSREKEKISGYGGGVIFDANKTETWQNLRKLKTDGIIISFPLNDCTCQDDLWDLLSGLSSRILIIGTTSGFQKDLKEVTDISPIDMSNMRSSSEEGFRQKGASVIHSAGIYGPDRNPIDWLRKGLIKNRAGIVNLIHGEDLARACSFILENFNKNERFVISDGNPYKWSEIISFAVEKKYITGLKKIHSDEAQMQRIVKPLRLFEMGFRLRHPSLFDEIKSLEPPEIKLRK